MDRITSRKNPKIRYWRKLAGDPAFRRESGEFLCDGAKLLEEAVSGGTEVTALIAGEKADVPELPGVPVYRLPEDLLAYVSPVKTPQGLLFTCRLPARSGVPEGSRFVVLEGVQDPGNVGTVIRTARAMGYDGVLLLPGCADLYGPRTVRATMGALFRQPAAEIGYDDLERLRDGGVTLYATAPGGDCTDVRDADYGRFAVCIGSEGRGLSDRLLALCGRRLTIPMRKDCESLNAAVAAAIVMWESVRKADPV